MYKDINQVNFVIFDTETTGLEPDTGDRIIEIAAIKLEGDRQGAVFHSLVNPGRCVSWAAFQVNHISDEMLTQAPTIEKVLPGFLEFVKGSVVCSYNAGFDLGFIKNEAKLIRMNLPEDLIFIDILLMAKKLIPRIERYALWHVASFLNIETVQQHRALSDVQLTIEVFNRLRSLLEKKGLTDFMQFTSLFSVNSPFMDKINNKKISEIQQAIDLGMKLKIKYFTRSEAEITERLVTPKQIIQEKSREYLVGKCHLRNEERTFRIDGILHIEIV